MKDKLLIIGASGHGKVVADIALKMNKWKKVAFLDDDTDINTSMRLEILGIVDEVFTYLDEWEVFVGIGNNAIRERIQKMLETEGACIPKLIHPNAVIGTEVVVGTGTVVMAGVVINCCTKIGKGCIINTGVTVDHDNVIDDYVHISPGAHLAGTVKVAQRSWLGMGCLVINNINIFSECKIGAGTVVVKDITDSGVYIGVPARKIE